MLHNKIRIRAGRVSSTLSRLGARVLLGALAIPLLIPAGYAEASIASWQRSISIYPMTASDFGSSGFDQVVTHAKSLGFNYVTLVIPYYQSNIYSTDITPAGNAPSDATLVSAIKYVHSQGMGVILKIHLDPGDGNWRALINPSDRSTWFANYRAILLRYASIAQQNAVEEICIGTELISMSSANVNSGNTAQWQQMISAVRGAYSGKLFYDANWGGGTFENEPAQIGFWGSLDYIGISAYYNLDGDGSVASLESDWSSINSSIIGPLSSQFGKPVLFSEIGYRSVVNAHLQPWNSGLGGAYSAQEQVNDYTALLQYWNDYQYMQGIGVWYGNSNPASGGAGDTDYLIQNKPVEDTIKQLFMSSGSGTASPPPAGPVSFSTSASISPASPAVGTQSAISVSVVDQSGTVTGANVDLEIYDSHGARVFQQVFASQDFSAGQAQRYTAAWTPAASGAYTAKVGVFDSSWANLYQWNDAAGAFSVGAGGAPTGPQAMHVWWPGSGISVSGVQPFKAVVDALPLSAYTMYWQVDGGVLNPMYDSSDGAPHKEAMVDLGPWTWRGSGPYVVNFVAKDSAGSVISQQSVSIYVR